MSKSKSLGALLVQILDELGRTKVPQEFHKFGFSNKCPKIYKILGGLVLLVLEEIEMKAVFFRSSLIKDTLLLLFICLFETVMRWVDIQKKHLSVGHCPKGGGGVYLETKSLR